MRRGADVLLEALAEYGVSLPIDVLEQETAEAVRPLGALYRAPQPEAAAVARMAETLGRARQPAIVVGDGIARSGARNELVELAELLGAADRPYPHMNLTEPELDFVAMAAGMGVAGRRVEHPAELGEALQEAFAAGGPRVLDVIVGGRV